MNRSDLQRRRGDLRHRGDRRIGGGTTRRRKEKSTRGLGQPLGQPSPKKSNPPWVGPTLAAGVGWSRVGILQPAPAPAATRPAKPAGFDNP